VMRFASLHATGGRDALSRAVHAVKLLYASCVCCTTAPVPPCCQSSSGPIT
jgi:hypothetical protein